jgi:hypothetical protein
MPAAWRIVWQNARRCWHNAPPSPPKCCGGRRQRCTQFGHKPCKFKHFAVRARCGAQPEKKFYQSALVGSVASHFVAGQSLYGLLPQMVITFGN